jgi:cell division protein FtsL
MTGLETAFYIVALIYMGIMLILFIALLTAVLVIKKKVDHLHQMVDERVEQVKNAADKVATLVATVKHFVKK